MTETRCYVCGHSDFDHRLVDYIYHRQGRYLVVQKVPCEVCLHCGERYYGGTVLLEIEQRFKAIYEEHVSPQFAMSIPVEVYGEKAS